MLESLKFLRGEVGHKAILAAISLCCVVPGWAALKDCNVSWEGLGKSSFDSMPLGNGDVGLNVWTEPNGDIL